MPLFVIQFLDGGTMSFPIPNPIWTTKGVCGYTIAGSLITRGSNRTKGSALETT